MKELTDEEIASGCIMSTNGIKRWFNKEGQLHRDNGPAVIYPNNVAVIYPNNVMLWFKDGMRHREDGPAVDYRNSLTTNEGKCLWYINNQRINCSSQEEFEKLIKLKAFW